MQIDSQMHFSQDWDKISISMLKQVKHSSNTLSEKTKKKTVLSYLPSPYEDAYSDATSQLPIICGGYFSLGAWDGQMIRLNATILSQNVATGAIMGETLSSSLSLSSSQSPFVVTGNLFTTSGKVKYNVGLIFFFVYIHLSIHLLLYLQIWKANLTTFILFIVVLFC